MMLIAAMSLKDSEAISNNTNTTMSDEDIERTTEISKILKDVEEEKNEHHDSTTSFEYEHRKINSEYYYFRWYQ